MKKGVRVALLVGAPLLVLGAGGVVAAGLLGYLSIPGLSPGAKVKTPAAAGVVASKPERAAATTPVVRPAPRAKSVAPAPRVRVTTPDPVRGDKRLARLWNELEPAKLAEIAKDWREEDLARVLLRMDTGVVAEMISAMPDAKKASSLSRRLRELASIPPAADE